MLTQVEADRLMGILKQFVDRATIQFPLPGQASKWEVKSEDGRESFFIDAQRKGKIKRSKCTFMERYRVIEVLLRLDIDGPPHDNPDGTEVPCPHLHVYREGFADKWAYSVPSAVFTDTLDLVKTLREFLEYCKVQDIPAIQKGIQ
jgi:hypothetical protein